jgi:dihydropteroate synthase
MNAEKDPMNTLDDAIHHMAQPLTALTFVIRLGQCQRNPQALTEALDTAAEECRRAVQALNEVRHAAAAMAPNGREHA